MLRREFFADPALTPAATWLGGPPPGRPTITVGARTATGTSVTLAPSGAAPRWWVVRSRAGNEWTTRVIFGAERTIDVPSRNGGQADWIVANAVSAAGATSEDAVWRAGTP
jgi:hypothetical protein